MRWQRDVAVVVGVCAIALVLGALSKACRGFWHDPSSLVCHSDIRALYPCARWIATGSPSSGET